MAKKKKEGLEDKKMMATTDFVLRPMNGHRGWYPRRNSGVRFGVLARAGHHGGVLLHNFGDLLAKRVLWDDRSLLATSATVPRVVVARRMRRLPGCMVGGRLAGRLVSFGVAAERTLLRTRRILSSGAAATRRSYDANGRTCRNHKNCNRQLAAVINN